MSLPDSATLTRTLTIDARARRLEGWLASSALLASVVATALLAMQSVLAAMLSVTMAMMVIAGLWWHGWLGGPRRLNGFSWLSDGCWLLSDSRHRAMPAELLRDTRVGSGWLWLCWHTEPMSCSGAPLPRRRSMLILRGDLAAADLRRLSVRLRLDPASRQQTDADRTVP